jgi:hypothetical protein
MESRTNETSISTKVMAELDTQIAQLKSNIDKLDSKFASVISPKLPTEEAPIEQDPAYPSLFLMIHQFTAAIQKENEDIVSIIERSAL